MYIRLLRRAKEKIQGNIKYRWNKKGLNYRYIPWLLWLEVTSKCNANCIFCARSDVKQPAQHMDFEVFKKIIDATPFATQIHTQGFGEPLMWPDLVRGVAYANSKGLRVVFYTNASLLDDEMAIGLLNAGVSQIRFSVDGMSAEEYEPLRKGLKWETVLANIENFQKRKNEGNFKTETVIRMCVTKENRENIQAVMDFWRPKVDVVSTMPERDIQGYTETRINPFTHYKPIKCENPYTQLAVKSNGDMVLCCVDWFHNYVVGNVNDWPITTNNLLRLFNSRVYNDMREGLETGINCPSKCLSCTGYISPKRWETDDSENKEAE